MEMLFGIFIILLGIVILISGPVALTISIIALNKANRLMDSRFNPSKSTPVEQKSVKTKPQHVTQPVQPAPVPPSVMEQPKQPAPKSVPKPPVIEKEKITEALEQRIGTKWILIAGIITVIFGFGFFLKYAYDNALIGELGRVIIAACCGIIALIIGEIARRRGYGIVAKGTSALGFAILYATVFAAYRHYQLIDSIPAFGLAIVVTVVAMLYAVVLDEILIAFLSLLGGFVTPVILSTGENLPNSLFGYVLILSLGAIFCGYYRKWRTINWLCFLGTFGLYTAWFEKFFRDTLYQSYNLSPQMTIALCWLSIFFIVYLVLPVLYNLIKKIDAHKDDVVLIATNSLVVFHYLCTILYNEYRTPLAISVAGLGIIHILFMFVSMLRCPKESGLKVALLTIGLLFMTIAIPLYYEMYALSAGWAVKAVIITLIGIRYKSNICQLFGFTSIILCVGNLLYCLPMHTGQFRLFFNAPFGTWVLTAVALLVIYLLYRFSNHLQPEVKQAVTQIYYIATILLFFAAIAIQWYHHCSYNISKDLKDIYLIRVAIIIPSVALLLLVLKPLCPKGDGVKTIAIAIAITASCSTLICFSQIYKDHFMIFANLDFGIGLIFITSLFIASVIFKYKKQQDSNAAFSRVVGLLGVFVLWSLLTMQIYSFWYCRDKYLEPIENWSFIANMNVSVMWAVYALVLMIFGFIRKVPMHRYISLCIFALLLIKVFLYDTRNLENIYRITAFLATGVIMVGVSYLYQFLKKKGFFENLLTIGDKS